MKLVVATNAARHEDFILLINGRGHVVGAWTATRALVGDLGLVFAGVMPVSDWISGADIGETVADYGKAVAVVTQGHVSVSRMAEWKRILGVG